jgi:hypothetical protein
MMNTSFRIISLFAVSLFAAVVWRVEVEIHGWHGLVWLSYFHWAVPTGILMFAAWLAVFSVIRPLRRRITFAITFVAFAAMAYLIAYSSITTFYSRVMGPLSVFPWWFRIWYFSFFIIFPLVPIVFLLIARFFCAHITIWRSALSLGLYACSFPIAILLLRLVAHKGQSDFLHAIKSGFVIPFLILSFGIPFVFGETMDRGQQSHAPDAIPRAGDA